MKDIIENVGNEFDIENGNTLIVGSVKPEFNIKDSVRCDLKTIPSKDFNLVILSSDDKLPEIAKVIWNNTAYGGYAIITNIKTPQIENRILAFLKSKEKYYFRKRRMMVNGTRETFLCFKIFNPNKRKEVVENALSHGQDIKIACVLRTSKDYSHRDVNILAKCVKKHFTLPHEFVAIVDKSKGIDRELVDRIVPSKHNYPSWWCKMELFREDVFKPNDRIIYFDLDTAIIDNIDFMTEQNESFVGLRDFYNMFNFASGVMSWVGAAGYNIAESFDRESKKVMSTMKAGDQVFIASQVDKPKFWQDLFPNKVISFKKDMKERNINQIPEDAAVICFHGKPKLFDCGNANILKLINN